ncbi:hypothetical protein RRG08_008209 [Elysia crispata]|uniref:G-protein coupled receptors family 3 profile domain-containing protein n=1 Tax=Elysia crispata TaxID=231223 RepID=A0AAE0Z0I4_9GAST|nr:hypothetical protein RRG08_008209 [Elysia crispata]
MICDHNPRFCYQLSSVIGSLDPSVVFGYKAIFLAYETQNIFSMSHHNLHIHRIICTPEVCSDHLKEALKGPFITDSIILHQEPRLTEVAMVEWRRVVFGYKVILLICGIVLAYETLSVRLKQVNDFRFVGMSIYNVVHNHFLSIGIVIKLSLICYSRIRIAEAPVAYDAVWVIAFSFPNAAAKDLVFVYSVLCETLQMLFVITAPISLIFGNQENMTFDFVSLAIVLCSILSVGLIIVPEVSYSLAWAVMTFHGSLSLVAFSDSVPCPTLSHFASPSIF